MPRVTFTDDIPTYSLQNPERQSPAPLAVPRPMVLATLPSTLLTDNRGYRDLRNPKLTHSALHHLQIAHLLFHQYAQL